MALALWAASASPLGKSTYRFVGISVPAQFIPYLSFEAKMNNAGTNTWVKVDSRYPITATVEGVISQTNEFKMYTEFSCLQSILAATERERLYDEHVRFLLTHKTAILQGNVLATADTPVIPNP